MRLRTVLLSAIIAVLSASGAAAAAELSATLSDLMTRVQLQHAKLWFAGKLSNWNLADYELQQIDANLEATSRLLANPSQADRASEQIRAVRQALLSKDGPAFMTSYAGLTNECNGCHRSSGYAWIVMQIPLTLPVPNQLFVDQVSEGRAIANASCGMCQCREGSTCVPATPTAFPADRQPTVLLPGRSAALSDVRPSATGTRPGHAESEAVRIPGRGGRGLSGDVAS